VALNEPPGEFAYLWDDWDDPDDDAGIAEEFHASEPVTAELTEPPWYRSKSAMIAFGIIASGVVAIVVSAGLLVAGQSHGPREVVEPAPATTSETAAIPAATLTPTITSAAPPIAPPTNTASVIVEPTYEPRPTKPPETQVTHGPTIRLPISVSPTPHPAFPHN